MADPLLSITVLNYNYAHYLPTCLDSILAQTFRDFEVLLINDKSTDDSLDVIRPYLSDPRIRLIDHEKNQGFSRSLKEGSEGSHSKYMTVVSADDWILEPTALEKQVALLERDDQLAFAFTNYGCYRGEQECTYVVNPAAESYVRPGIEVFPEVILRQTTPLHSGTVIRRTAYEKIGGYDLVTRYASDARMWAGLCHAGKVGYINEVLYAYRIHENNMSKGKDVVKRSIEEDLAIIDWSFGLMLPAERARFRALYKRAVKRTLSTYPVFFTFRENNPRMGWYFMWVGAKLRPTETLLQPTTLALALRSVLGSRGYELVERGRALFSRSTRERLRRQARPANG
jgi:glycosyltransferase involved in cell wall biosynthesis